MRRRSLHLFAGLLWLAQIARAADAGSTTSILSADQQWDALVAAVDGRTFAPPASLDASAISSARAAAVAALVSDADKLRAFYSLFPNHPRAIEAKCREALTLVRGWQMGDAGNVVRRNQLVATIRQDTTIPTLLRAHVAAFADNVAIGLRPNLTQTERLAAYEQAVRALISEFPGHPTAYQSLVQIGKMSAPDRAVAIARDVVAMPDAPAAVMADAQTLLERHALVGQPLQPMVTPILGADNPFAKASGKTVVVYSWANTSDVSVKAAQDLAAKVPTGMEAIGVCLDFRDLAPAKQRAATLPGTQIYDWLGVRGEVAEQLRLNQPGLVYLIGPDGTVRSVSAHLDLNAALSAAANW